MVRIKSEGDKLIVECPFTAEFAIEALRLGGEWNGRWSFPSRQTESVRALCLSCFGHSRHEMPTVLTRRERAERMFAQMEGRRELAFLWELARQAGKPTASNSPIDAICAIQWGLAESTHRAAMPPKPPLRWGRAAGDAFELVTAAAGKAGWSEEDECLVKGDICVIALLSAAIEFPHSECQKHKFLALLD